jgi:hypothetical protein
MNLMILKGDLLGPGSQLMCLAGQKLAAWSTEHNASETRASNASPSKEDSATLF